MTSYKRIKAVKTVFNILQFLSDQKQPVSGKDISLALGIKYDTAMCYLASLEDVQYVRQNREKYEIGQGIAYIWARYTANLKGKISRLTDELHGLEV